MRTKHNSGKRLGKCVTRRQFINVDHAPSTLRRRLLINWHVADGLKVKQKYRVELPLLLTNKVVWWLAVWSSSCCCCCSPMLRRSWNIWWWMTEIDNGRGEKGGCVLSKRKMPLNDFSLIHCGTGFGIGSSAPEQILSILETSITSFINTIFLALVIFAFSSTASRLQCLLTHSFTCFLFIYFLSIIAIVIIMIIAIYFAAFMNVSSREPRGYMCQYNTTHCSTGAFFSWISFHFLINFTLELFFLTSLGAAVVVVLDWISCSTWCSC